MWCGVRFTSGGGSKVHRSGSGNHGYNTHRSGSGVKYDLHLSDDGDNYGTQGLVLVLNRKDWSTVEV